LLTSKGFKRKTYEDFLEEIKAETRGLWGEDVNLSSKTPLGKHIESQAWQRSIDAEQAEQVYNSRFVDTSEGLSLQQNVKRALIDKNGWVKAIGKVNLSLDRNITVPAGTMIGTKYGVLYATEAEVKSTDAGIYEAGAKALEYGESGNAAAGEITEIINPIVGLKAVTNPDPFLNGQDEETDPQLKDRYYDSLGKLGNRRKVSVRARLLDEVNGVRSVIVDENDTLETSATGVPGKAFETIVLGGLRDEVARVILLAKPDGIQAYGQEIVLVEDSQGYEHKIGFTYATTVQVYVRIAVQKGPDYPIDGNEQVKQRIVKYIGGVYGNDKLKGLGMNEDVIRTKAEGSVSFTVEGVKDVQIELSKDGITYSPTNVSIKFAEVAETDISKIEVSELV